MAAATADKAAALVAAGRAAIMAALPATSQHAGHVCCIKALVAGSVSAAASRRKAGCCTWRLLCAAARDSQTEVPDSHHAAAQSRAGTARVTACSSDRAACTAALPCSRYGDHWCRGISTCRMAACMTLVALLAGQPVQAGTKAAASLRAASLAAYPHHGSRRQTKAIQAAGARAALASPSWPSSSAHSWMACTMAHTVCSSAGSSAAALAARLWGAAVAHCCTQVRALPATNCCASASRSE